MTDDKEPDPDDLPTDLPPDTINKIRSDKVIEERGQRRPEPSDEPEESPSLGNILDIFRRR
jgi:hypothetical protein